MATVNIVFSYAYTADSGVGGGVPAYNGRYTAQENKTSSGTSGATTITALAGQTARITVTGGNIYVAAPATSPTAVNATGWLVLNGTSLDLTNLRLLDKIAIIDAS
jgi:hypothetical protein